MRHGWKAADPCNGQSGGYEMAGDRFPAEKGGDHRRQPRQVRYGCGEGMPESAARRGKAAYVSRGDPGEGGTGLGGPDRGGHAGHPHGRAPGARLHSG